MAHSSPALGADGTIYVGDLSGRIYAVKRDGTQKWAFTTGDYVCSSPAVGADGTIYVGSRDGNLYAINPDGSRKWACYVGQVSESSPAVGPDGTVYVGASWTLYAVYGDSLGLAGSTWPMFHHDLKHTGSSNVCISFSPSIPFLMLGN